MCNLYRRSQLLVSCPAIATLKSFISLNKGICIFILQWAPQVTELVLNVVNLILPTISISFLTVTCVGYLKLDLDIIRYKVVTQFSRF